MHKISQWCAMSTAVIMVKIETRCRIPIYGGRLGEFHGMSSHSHLPYCRVLPTGEFNVMIPELRVTLQGGATGKFNGRILCHVIPQPPAILQGATLQGVITPSTILKIVVRHFLFFNAVWALTIADRRLSFVSSSIDLLSRRSR